MIKHKVIEGLIDLFWVVLGVLGLVGMSISFAWILAALLKGWL